jgi:hypothetical protein
MTNTRAIWLRSGSFLAPPAPSLQIHWPLVTGHWLLLPPHPPLATLLLQYVTGRTIPSEKSIRSCPPAAAHPLIILSWPEALDASSFRRACGSVPGRTACPHSPSKAAPESVCFLMAWTQSRWVRCLGTNPIKASRHGLSFGALCDSCSPRTTPTSTPPAALRWRRGRLEASG